MYLKKIKSRLCYFINLKALSRFIDAKVNVNLKQRDL